MPRWPRKSSTFSIQAGDIFQQRSKVGRSVRSGPTLLLCAYASLVPVFAVAFVLPVRCSTHHCLPGFRCRSAPATGWTALRHGKLNAGSDFGRMLDPIADKVLVAVALMMLVAEGDVSEFNLTTGLHSLLRLVPALIILSREILVSGLREFLAGTRVSVPVTAIAKFKTAVQMVAIGAMILTPLADDFLPGVPALSYAAIAYALLWIAAALTVYTGVIYFRTGMAHLKPTRRH